MTKKKIKTIRVQCTNCSYKTWRKDTKFYTDTEMTCPKCQEYAGLTPIEEEK